MFLDTITVEMRKHYAEDAGKSEEEIAEETAEENLEETNQEDLETN